MKTIADNNKPVNVTFVFHITLEPGNQKNNSQLNQSSDTLLENLFQSVEKNCESLLRVSLNAGIAAAHFSFLTGSVPTTVALAGFIDIVTSTVCDTVFSTIKNNAPELDALGVGGEL